MTERRTEILADAIELAYGKKYVRPIMGFWTENEQTNIDFSVDIYSDTIPACMVPKFIGEVEKVYRFCENLNAKNIIEVEADEAIANEDKIIGMLAKAIETEDYETIYDFIGW